MPMSVSDDTRNEQLLKLIASFEDTAPRTSEHVASLTHALNSTSSDLASSKQLRIRIGTADPSIWPSLRQLWSTVSRLVRTLDDDDDLAGTIDARTVHSLVLSLAKITRNLVAEVQHNQRQAFATGPDIRQLLVYYTSWTRENEETSYPATRILTQTLSNIVTGNDELQDRLWKAHIVVPVEHSILTRLIASRDPRTLVSTLVLILNCIRFSRERAQALSTTAAGGRICVAILDWMEAHVDSTDIEQAPTASDDEHGKVFELGYSIFSSLFEQGLFGELYHGIAVQDEVIAPPQITLLKLLDSYLHSQPMLPPETSTTMELSGQLTSIFLALSGFAQQSIRLAVGAAGERETAGEARAVPATLPTEQESGGEMKALDLQLPSVCKALVLVAQCLVTILLLAENGGHQSRGNNAGQGVDTGRNTLKTAVLESRISEGGGAERGFIEDLTETLRLLDLFLPRLNFGKAIPSKLSSTSPLNAPAPVDATGFMYLKRDLVRLLGVLSHGSRAAQDRVRQCGGIPVVLNLCVIDDANPYLREHAIFALRNLLHNNPENQAVVDAIKPMGTWGEDGVLRDA